MDAHTKRDIDLLVRLRELHDENPHASPCCDHWKQIDSLLKSHFTEGEYFAVLVVRVRTGRVCDELECSYKPDWAVNELEYKPGWGMYGDCFSWEQLFTAVRSICALRQHVTEWVW